MNGVLTGEFFKRATLRDAMKPARMPVIISKQTTKKSREWLAAGRLSHATDLDFVLESIDYHSVVDFCGRLRTVLNDLLAARQGFEPRYAAPEAAVLPLNERAPNLTRGWAREFIEFHPGWAAERKCQLVHHKRHSRPRSNSLWRAH